MVILLVGCGRIAFDARGDATDNSDALVCQPTTVVGALAAGERHTCGLDLSGGTYCWGNNTEGELGTGTRISSDTPVRTRLPGASKIVTGLNYTCAIDPAQTLWCWGATVPISSASEPVRRARSTRRSRC